MSELITMPSPIVSVSEEQIRTIETGRNRLLERAEALEINSPETEQVGWALINGIADLEKSIIADFSESKKLAHAAWKAICSQENGHLDKLAEPNRIVRGKLSAWDAEKKQAQAAAERQDREARAVEQRRLQAIADEEAKAEQERRRKALETQRIEEALEAERAGKSDIAAAILEKPIEVAPVVAAAVVIPPSVVPSLAAQKVEGAGSMVDDWTFTITNADAIPREYLLVNEQAIAKVVKALKKVAEKTIPGIEVTNIPKPRTSARRS